MSWPASVVNQTMARIAAKGRASTTTRRKTRTPSRTSTSSLTATAPSVPSSVTGCLSMACPEIHAYPASCAM